MEDNIFAKLQVHKVYKNCCSCVSWNDTKCTGAAKNHGSSQQADQTDFAFENLKLTMNL